MRKLVIIGLATGLLLILGALRAINLDASHEDTVQAARTQAASLALILSEYIAGTFATGDAALRQLALHSQRIGGPTAPASEWVPSLNSARSGLRGIGAITVVDRELIIRHSTRGDIVGESRRGDASIESVLQKGHDKLFVGMPFLAPTTGRYLIPVGRPLLARDGTVEGAVVASFLPQDLRAFFQSLNVGSGGRLWIFHTSGVVVLQEPSAEDAMGRPADDNPLFAAARGSERASGVVEGAITADRPVMISAYRHVAGLPLVVAVSLDRDEILLGWSRELRGFVATYAVVSVLLVGVLFVLSRQIDASAAAEAALERARRTEAERLRDVNERLSTMLDREQAARREAETANAMKDEFVMTVSHELRTPLTAIAGWARLLVDGLVPEDEKEVALRTIERNAEAQKHLIEDLLDIAGIIAGKLRLGIKPIAVAEVMQNAVDAVTPAADAKGIRLETSLDSSLGSMAADPDRLQQIVWSLLSNAVKFTPNGGWVTLDVARSADALQVTVSDTGIGITPELLPHVFDRFRQGASGHSRRHGGLGLGLAIARNLVELHGGTITASSEGEGKGATFHVSIPAR